MKVEAYRNLHNGCYSIRALEGPEKGKVIEHVKSLVISEPEFIVQPAGRDKVRREHKKNVHAFVRGYLGSKTWEDFWRSHIDFTWGTATYNPYTDDQWQGDGKPLDKARIAVLDFNGEHSHVAYF